ncbi:MAG: PilZ domain-containing protein [Methylococcales bacterium]|nr:PilZ domain-containing protein [Methylococcales bacterium]
MAEAPRQSILSLSIKDKNALYAAYMPFIVHGGLFIPTDKDYQLGEDVFMLLNLMESAERLPIAGTIIWKTPAGAEGYRTAGVGVQFNGHDGGSARTKIENYLAGALAGERSTHTL